MIAIRRCSINVSVPSLNGSTHDVGRIVAFEVPGAETIGWDVLDGGGVEERDLLLEGGGGEGGEEEEEGGLELHRGCV